LFPTILRYILGKQEVVGACHNPQPNNNPKTKTKPKTQNKKQVVAQQTPTPTTIQLKNARSAIECSNRTKQQT